jgi:hypothetical protein
MSAPSSPFPAADAHLAWRSLRGAYVDYFTDRNYEMPRWECFDIIDDILHTLPIHICGSLVRGGEYNISQACDYMKKLHNRIVSSGFQCEGAQAMEFLSAAIEGASQGQQHGPIQLMRQFESEVMFGLPQLTNEEFRALEQRILESYEEQEPLPEEDNEEERLDRELASSVLTASALPQPEEPAFEIVPAETLYNELWGNQ